MIIEQLLQDALWSAVAALGFAVLFNTPKRALWVCALAAAIGHALRTFLVEQALSLELTTLISAVTIGFVGDVAARRLKIPQSVFTIPAAIPLVPGSFAFRTMMSILQLTNQSIFANDPILTEAVTNGVKTGLILGAIAVGIAAPNLLFHRPRPVV